MVKDDIFNKKIIKMKKPFFIFILMMIISSTAYTQEVTTNWPYIYNDFTKGTVYYSGGEKTEALMNIHLLRSKLHYLDKETIKEAKSEEILIVEIGADKYFAFNDQMLKVISGTQTSFLGELTYADLSSLNESGGAYGSSSNSMATKKLSSVDMRFAGNFVTNHIELKNSKDNGTLLLVSKKYYIVSNGDIYLATQKGINSKLSADKKIEFEAFIKKNKIKWKTPESLIVLLEFFEGK